MIFQCCMYYLSFAPVWCSILFIEIMSLIHGTTDGFTEMGYIVSTPLIMGLSLIYVEKVLGSNRFGGHQCELKAAKEEKMLSAEFLAAYILPLFAFDFTLWEGMVLFIFFFCVFGWLCIRHNYFCTNIILDVLKYRVYDTVLVENGMEIEVKVVSKRNLKAHIGENVIIKWFNNDYSYELSTLK